MRPVVPRPVHRRRYRPRRHLRPLPTFQQMRRRPGSVQPFVKPRRLQNHRHPVMHRLYQTIGWTSNHRAGGIPAGVSIGAKPNARHHHHPAVRRLEPPRPPAPARPGLPLVKPVGRHQTPVITPIVAAPPAPPGNRFRPDVEPGTPAPSRIARCCPARCCPAR